MAGHIVAILLFAASSLAAQPLVFGVTERLPSDALHVEGTGPLPLMTTNGDGFVALDGHTLVKLDDAGNTLLRSSFAPALNISAESLWPLGRDYLLGTVIEPAWIVDGETLAIRQLPARFSYPAALATNGSTILVLEPSARATLLDRNGTVLSPPKPLFAPSPAQGLGAVATDGVGYFVVWKDEFLLRSVRVDAAGSVSSKETLRALEVSQYPLFPPRVAFGGGKFLVIWQDSNKLYAQLRNADGSEAAGVVVLDTNLPKADSAVWDGAEFLVTFGSRFARIGGDGKLLDVPRPLDAAPGRTIRGAVAAANGHATIVARHEACSCGECVEARVGALHGPSVVFGGEDVEGAAAAAVVAATEQATVVAYEIRSDVARVRIAFIPSRGQPIAVPSLRGSQSQPGIATDGETFLVTWLENDDQCRLQVVAAVMDASGRFGPPVQLSDKPVALSPPAVTWNGSEYAVVWNRLYSQVAAVRVTRFGRPLGAPIDLTDEEPGDLSSLSIAWTGNGYAAGWSERVHVNHDPFDAYEYRLRALGPDLRPRAPVAVLGPGTSGNVAWNGLEAVVFRRSGSRMEMAHLDADGRAGESKYVAVYLPTLLDPSVAWHNGEWLVTGVGTTGGRIARVTDDGNVVEDIDILEGDEHTPLSAVRVAATPSRVAVTVETFNPPQTVTVRTTDPQPPRHHVVRGLP